MHPFTKAGETISEAEQAINDRYLGYINWIGIGLALKNSQPAIGEIYLTPELTESLTPAIKTFLYIALPMENILMETAIPLRSVFGNVINEPTSKSFAQAPHRFPIFENSMLLKWFTGRKFALQSTSEPRDLHLTINVGDEIASSACMLHRMFEAFADQDEIVDMLEAIFIEKDPRFDDILPQEFQEMSAKAKAREFLIILGLVSRPYKQAQDEVAKAYLQELVIPIPPKE